MSREKELIGLLEQAKGGFGDRKIGDDYIDQALSLLKAQPKPTEFTKGFRKLIELSKKHLSKPKIERMKTKSEEACGIINRLTEANKALTEKLRGMEEALRLYRQDDLSAEEESKKYEKPCPYNKTVPCVQYPEESCGCDFCEECETKLKKAEELAQLFHETYEELAPEFDYKTRDASRKPWEDVPEQNKNLMIAVAGKVLTTQKT